MAILVSVKEPVNHGQALAEDDEGKHDDDDETAGEEAGGLTREGIEDDGPEDGTHLRPGGLRVGGGHSNGPQGCRARRPKGRKGRPIGSDPRLVASAWPSTGRSDGVVESARPPPPSRRADPGQLVRPRPSRGPPARHAAPGVNLESRYRPTSES